LKTFDDTDRQTDRQTDIQTANHLHYKLRWLVANKREHSN